MSKPLIVHVLHSLDTGGMERIVVSVINGTRDRYRHAVICLAGFGALRDEIDDPSIVCVSLGKRPGKDLGSYARLWRVLRKLRPDLVQTYNIGALDATLVARLAGVRRVVQAEHGRDVSDPLGRNRKYRLLRRWLQACISRFVAVSQDLATWLRDEIGIRPAKVVCIQNGIDTQRYGSTDGAREARPLLGSFAPSGSLLVGAVGRLDAVKDHVGLVDAFAMLLDGTPGWAGRLRLVIVGEGSERARIEQHVARLGIGDAVRLLGNCADVPALLQEFDLFVLSSIAEGIPLTVLEAMAAGLPVVATRVGGVGEVVADGETGALVEPSDPRALATALGRYVEDAGLRHRHGAAGRARVASRFGMQSMLDAYVGLYDGLLAGKPRARDAVVSAGLAGRGGP